MSKVEKLLRRFLSKPKDFTWQEFVRVLGHFGYEEITGCGSRRKFVNEHGSVISLHKPHPGNIVKSYMIKQVIEHLKQDQL